MRIGSSFLILGDCLDKLKVIPSNSVHAIITDIPYGINFSEWDILHENKNKALLGSSPAQKDSKVFKSRGKPKNGWSKEDLLIGQQFQSFYEKVFKEIYRVLLPAGSVVAFTGRQYQHKFINAGENMGLIFKDSLAWDKQQAPFRAQSIDKVLAKRGIEQDSTDRLGCLAPVFEPIVWMFKPYKVGTTLTDCYIKFGTGTFSDYHLKSNLIKVSSRIQNRQHETEKPLELMDLLLNTFSKRGQVILDPFMGSGTTGVSCHQTGRKFIGIEKNPAYYNMAVNRIKNLEVKNV